METDKDKLHDERTDQEKTFGDIFKKLISDDEPQLDGCEVIYPDGKGGGHFP